MAKTKYKDRMRVLFIASEVAPFVKAGGLADIVGSLPKALAEDYHMDVRIIVPRYKFVELNKWQAEEIIKGIKIKLPNGRLTKVDVYKTFIPNTIIPIYLLDMPKYFIGEGIYDHGAQGRESCLPFINFSKAALEVIRAMDWQPEIIHIHDWMPAIIPKWLKTIFKNSTFFRKTATVLTIHNIAFQGKMDFKEAKFLGLKRRELVQPLYMNGNKEINILGEGVLNADAVNTVSPTYAQEILTRKFGSGLEKLLNTQKKSFTGILNGIDYSSFDPRINNDTPVKYWIDSLDKKVENKLLLQKKLGLTQSGDLPLICTITRLTEQKGLDLIEDVLKELVDMGAQFIILGTGEEEIEKIFVKAEKKYPEAVAAEMRFDTNFAQTVYAGSDMILVPSRFEPCGLSQIIGMRFGTIPIVRKTGGLADTVRDGYTGFVFCHYDKPAFLWALQRAVDIYYNQKDFWRKMQVRAMRKDFSWTGSAKKYIWLYKKAIRNHNAEMKKE